MAHGITETDKVAFSRTPAWHGLGTVTDHMMTPDEAYELAGLDWEVELHPVAANLPDGSTIDLPQTRALVRQDTRKVLGTTGLIYKPYQNRELKSFLKAVVGEGAGIESCGSLWGGQKVWFLVNTRHSFEVLPNDEVKSYLLFVNGHADCMAQAMGTGVRVVCQNTMTMAMGDGTRVRGHRIRHDGRLHDNIEEAKVALKLAAASADRMKVEAEALVRKQLKTDELAAFFAGIVRDMEVGEKREKEVLTQFHTLLESDTNTMTGMRGTAWAAFNTYTEWLDHQPRRMSAMSRFDSNLMGEGARLKNEAWRTLLSTAV